MERRHFIKALIAVGACPACVGIASAEDAKWGYGKKDGPKHWSEVDTKNLVCSEGMQQSPIDISGEVAAELPPVEIDWKSGGGTLVNNGHTIQIDMPSGSTLKRGEDVYDLVQFHFHSPSEHHVHGENFPMEAHFVHRNPETHSFGVLAVFLVPGQRNKTFAQLASAFPSQNGVDVCVKDADPNGLLPASLGYWFYEGSLTTPPCSEDVDWIIAKESVEVDPEDIAKFTAIYPTNARPIKLPNRRFILSTL